MHVSLTGCHHSVWSGTSRVELCYSETQHQISLTPNSFGSNIERHGHAPRAYRIISSTDSQMRPRQDSAIRIRAVAV
eukprot:210122-Prymnesium_polylepis.1